MAITTKEEEEEFIITLLASRSASPGENVLPTDGSRNWPLLLAAPLVFRLMMEVCGWGRPLLVESGLSGAIPVAARHIVGTLGAPPTDDSRNWPLLLKNYKQLSVRTSHYTPVPVGCTPYSRDIKSYDT